ncbi:ly-6/neurotoxin-like protein 1 [Asterias amurensis]|uniref:ly-6/neurotoxin-like protein 1 n=1 Tax=Asterias amurensis TaxID=7602 RepID=UPI003AB71746
MKGPMYAMLVLGLVGLAASRQCYDCEYNSYGYSGNSCEAPDPTAKKSTCNGECQKVYIEGGGVVSITRSCSTLCYAIDCVESNGAKVCTTCCNSDLCNSAGSVTFNLVAMVSLVATVWGLSK